MKIKNIIFSIAIAGTCAFSTSCSDYLDVSSELVAGVNMDDIFENPDYTRNWYGTVFANISEFSETGSEASAFKNPWSNMCGEISSQMMPGKDAMTSGYTSATAQFHRWTDIYKSIRQGMIFLERAKPVGSGSNQVTEVEILRMKDEVKYMIAYYYFSLFELYGPVPIVTVIDDPAYPEVTDYRRATVDEMVAHIDGLLKEAIEGNNLPESVITSTPGSAETTFDLQWVVRPTKMTARALRAKLWVYAASKLYNGGWKDAVELVDSEGRQLFPAEDRSKWETAKLRLEELLTAAEAAGHKLYEVKNSQGVAQADASIYKLFQVYNAEILWCSTNNSYSDEYKMEKRTNPRDVNACYGTIGPTQGSVDMFFMKSGLTINDPGTEYRANAMVQVTNTAYADDGTTFRDDANIFNMYANREPRFYAAVKYQGQSWIKPFMDQSGHSNYTIDFTDSGDRNSAGPKSKDTPLVGYMLGKFKNRSIDHASGGAPNLFRRVSIIYRLADFYLYYAEVLNELNPNDPKIIEYLDKVRTRAGIPGYAEMEANGKKTISGNYNAQFDAIQRERFVELFCEGQRYFDIRRWMICGPGQAADQTLFKGMDEYGEPNLIANRSFFKVVDIEKRLWYDRMYFYPISLNVVQLSKGLIVQNPGW